MKKRLFRVWAVVGIAVLAMAVLWLFLYQEERAPLPSPTVVTRVVIEKAQHRLTLYDGDRMIRTYQVSLGRGGLAPKRYEGDKRTPEGVYRIDFHKEDSAYHRALHVSYPSAEDVRNAARLAKKPGGDIMIHGLRNGLGWLGPLHRFYDWTAGCIAVTNSEIEEMGQLVPDGTPIEIRP